MRLAAVRTEAGLAIGLVASDQTGVQVLDSAAGTVDDVVRGQVSVAALGHLAGGVPLVPIHSVSLASPLQRFNRDILCTGWNYLDHFHESTGKREGQDPPAMPSRPTFFTKGPGTVVWPAAPIAFDERLSRQWDYEAEIAVVIGRDGRSIPPERAWEHVFGFLLANDVSLRDVQRAHGGQWLKGKSVDQTMPLGPWLTTLDEIGDVAALDIECELNGALVQRATAGEMAFPIERLIAELSHGMMLRAGDVVLTGTPSGIGNARDPALFLRAGDVLITRSEALGQLRNTVISMALA